MLSFSRNPYTYGNGSEEINSPLLSIEVFDQSASGNIFTALNEPMEATLSTNLASNIDATLANVSSGKTNVHSYYIYHSEVSLKLNFNLGKRGATFDILGNSNKYPSKTENLFYFTISENTTEHNNANMVVIRREDTNVTLFIPGGRLLPLTYLHIQVAHIDYTGRIYG